MKSKMNQKEGNTSEKQKKKSYLENSKDELFNDMFGDFLLKDLDQRIDFCIVLRPGLVASPIQSPSSGFCSTCTTTTYSVTPYLCL